MMRHHYILNEKGEPVVEPDLITWAMWFEKAENRFVDKTEIGGEMIVSTVFLGLDHNFGDGPPLLWETMVFGGELDREMNRCSGSREQAEAMHRDMIERAQAVEALKIC